jgi:hypothetical protein
MKLYTEFLERFLRKKGKMYSYSYFLLLPRGHCTRMSVKKLQSELYKILIILFTFR